LSLRPRNSDWLRPAGTPLPGVLLPIVFVGLAAIMLADPWPYQRPYAAAQNTPAWATDTTPVRSPLMRPEIEVGAYRYRCNECHALFPSPPETERTLTQHREIVLEHGINKRCFNCHNLRDRNAYADDKGEAIPWDQPQLLCAKCHGPVYRDWTHGVHGRTNGYWDPTRGPRDFLRCVRCHDPHAPAFTPLKPAPPPNTLRMGEQHPGAAQAEETKNPLLIYRQQLQTVPPEVPGPQGDGKR